MRVLHPAQIHHLSDKNQPLSIFTLSVNPDNTRLATGGIDSKVKIWDAAFFLLQLQNNQRGVLDQISVNTEKGKAVEKSDDSLLCTMSVHSGGVLCVRWSPDGRYLASGSDDTIVVVWELDKNATAGKADFGSTDVNKETWKPRSRLPGHESDVTSVAWSDDGASLATGGLDSQILIWDALSFTLMHKIRLGTSIVKGLVWDPVGQYLASQSDDRTMKIFRTTDWKLEKNIAEPFIDAPNASLFRRLSWSPDGTYIACPNAMSGPIFVASIVTRGGKWSSDTSLVGHENVVDVTAFNPRIFLRDAKQGTDASNICNVLALSARSTISLWQTKLSKPLVVLHDVFARDIIDLSWSSDGTTLYACSSAGDVAIFQFTIAELGTLAPSTLKKTYHDSFEFKPTPRSARALTALNGSKATPNILQPKKKAKGPAPPPQNEPQKLTIVNGKKRIRPQWLGMGSVDAEGDTAMVEHQGPVPETNLETIETPGNAIAPNQFAPPFETNMIGNGIANGFTDDPMDVAMNHGSPVTLVGRQPRAGPSRLQTVGPMQGIGLPSWSANDPYSRKRRRDDIDSYPNTITYPRGRTLGGDRDFDLDEAEAEITDLQPAYVPKLKVTVHKEELQLAVPPVKSFGKALWDEGNDADSVEWRNFDSEEKPSEVCYKSKGRSQWLDYLPTFVVSGTANAIFAAASCEDSTLHIWSQHGRKVLPTVKLDAPCSFIDSASHYLLTLTAQGTLTIWDVSAARAVSPPISIHPLLSQPSSSKQPTPHILTVKVQKNGNPLIALSNGHTYSYDPACFAFVELSTSWWSKGSQFWETRTRRASVALSRNVGPVKILESEISDFTEAAKGVETDENTKMEIEGEEQEQLGEESDWKTAMSLGHLEARMSAAVVLDSAREYKENLLAYTRRLAEEGFKGKAGELVKDLMGPVYFKPGKEEKWDSKVCGMNKRDLLREVLNILAKTEATKKTATEAQDLLKRIAAE